MAWTSGLRKKSEMAWSDALLAGGFALAGGGLQQFFSWRNEKRKLVTEYRHRQQSEEHAAFVDLVKVGRRVQRALVDLAAAPGSPEARNALSVLVDQLAEAVVVLRLVVADATVVSAAEAFEEAAKRLEDSGPLADPRSLRMTPLIDVIRTYEARRGD